jgi:hypothetical protein
MHTMEVKTTDDLIARSEKESKFYNALRGTEEAGIEVRVPKVITYIANEMNLLGETFVTQTIEGSAVTDENGKVLIEFNNLLDVLVKFQYVCT